MVSGTRCTGTRRSILELPGGARLGTLICYESIFGELARTDRRRGADLLVNLTNDAWFGRDTWWGRTTALWQHPAHAVIRAIETRTGLVRAANTGLSMFVDPLGRTFGETPFSQPAVRLAIVHTTDSRSLYVRWGDWLATLAAMLALATLLLAWARPHSHG